MGAEPELIQLYDLSFSGCISCFSCKRISRKKDGVCAVQDDLTSVLDRVKNTDAMIIGTPAYYGAESASTRALLERLCFPYNKYAKDMRTLFPSHVPESKCAIESNYAMPRYSNYDQKPIILRSCSCYHPNP